MFTLCENGAQKDTTAKNHCSNAEFFFQRLNSNWEYIKNKKKGILRVENQGKTSENQSSYNIQYTLKTKALFGTKGPSEKQIQGNVQT